MAGQSLISVDKLTMRFGGLTALDELSMTVQEGEILGLLGPNGSGKTTFFNVLTGLYKASSGSIFLDGENIIGKTPQEVYRSGVARTFQRSRLSLSLTVFDNIVIGDYQHMQHGLIFNLLRRKAFRAEYEAYVEKVTALLEIFSPPLVGRLFEPVDSFTMIDRRRIEVCRALLSGPRLLLLDEPSAGMTHDETDELMQDILQVRGKLDRLSVVLIEHEMNVIERITDRCVVLNYGKKIAEGRYAEITADPHVQTAYLGEAA
ncbi:MULTISPECIES: ATP-binding cassette domain-containing protein [unclassified Polaromonas]|uniref:ABC transporter ATP-binding protein n=1 Tax=unclassified Polaromonas TaxID=2638319 RepID=UPI000BD82983|nr:MULTISPECIES: ATP-binding cassette domain-containing protein [unclassified Polaromonas]OYY35415.1 MAG: ABC transporter ATP-binding protein [Polaromonas sp. 35-63-35]OYZ19162.1 MAG: ABC transporter ATP-binding protein [Polaromonas sp. 16-63-31]OYZ78261.1 MAG: ABC transporter ATP-binding protein [Polaromonas sp. 24-63-21]OZA48820.1 MAG: ABC transporter ATP-binding protein [Polaromonas sp. 17-63-33]OZA87706.1 MAG: ABC transporter ATP-binding protein [Polaromonas sp. 39-63-25]